MSGIQSRGVDIALTNIRDDTIETIDALTTAYPKKYDIQKIMRAKRRYYFEGNC